MKGSVLYPLNALKDIYPDVYSERIKKYEWRKFMMEQRIPFLDCLWNDVLHMAAVNPLDIKKVLKEHGMGERIGSFYKIDPHLLEKDKTIVYLSLGSGREKMTEKDFAVYDPDGLEEYSFLPEETKQYYKEKLDNNENPLMYHKIPHILYKGTLDTRNLGIVETR